MKKKYMMLGTALSICTLLTGCKSEINLVNNEQMDMIANYAAKVVVDFTDIDYTYKPDILTEEEIIAMEPSTELTYEDILKQEQLAKEKYDNLAKYLNMENIRISFKDYVICQEYPNDEDALFVLPAQDGKMLFVVEYELYNYGSDTFVYEKNDEQVVFTLEVDSKNKVRSFKNILENDLANMENMTIEAGDTATGIIVFQVDEDKLNSFKTIKMQYKYKDSYVALPEESR